MGYFHQSRCCFVAQETSLNRINPPFYDQDSQTSPSRMKLEPHGISACPLLWQTDMQLSGLFIASSSFQSSDLSLSCHPGHRNSQTVKGVSFLGEDDKFVMSGSDDGHIYIWSSNDGILRQWLKGDKHVVNCLEPHPCQPLSFATSGAPSC